MTEDDLDAFMKRFEQPASVVQDELFPAVALVGGEEVRALACREIAELMERLGAFPSAPRFRTIVAIRNRLTHVYPDLPARQATNLNEAYEAVGDLLSAYEEVRRYLDWRLTPPAAA